MVVKFLTNLSLVGCIKKKSTLYEIFRFFRDVIPYNNRNDGGPAAGLLSLVEVPEKAIVPFMVNAFDYVTFIHMLT
jgi:hypothetical protein